MYSTYIFFFLFHVNYKALINLSMPVLSISFPKLECHYNSDYIPKLYYKLVLLSI